MTFEETASKYNEICSRIFQTTGVRMLLKFERGNIKRIRWYCVLKIRDNLGGINAIDRLMKTVPQALCNDTIMRIRRTCQDEQRLLNEILQLTENLENGNEPR